MKKVILIMAGFVLVTICGGCWQRNSTCKQPTTKFDQNKNLTASEKAYAQRSFDLMIKLKNASEVSLNVNEFFASYSESILDSDAYKKWGFGNKKDFSEDEKWYIIKLPEIEQTWQGYNSIKLDNLSDDEKKFLKQTHEKYGTGPIDLREEFRKENGKLLPDQERLFDLAESPTGHTKLDDRDLIFFYRMLPR